MERKITLEIPRISALSELGFKGESLDEHEVQLIKQFTSESKVSVRGVGSMVDQAGVVEKFWVDLLIGNVDVAIPELEQIIKNHNFPSGTRVVEVRQNEDGQDYLHHHIK